MTGISPDIIAVIGAGASGTLVATQLMQHARRPLHLLLIERRPLIGRGVAYSTTNVYHLLNTPAEKMSAYQDRSDHLVEWFQQRQDLPTEWEPIASWLWTLGSLRRGQLWETTAVSEIRQQAEQLALDVLKQVNDR